jgi:glyoxylase-like metal-dependent hydrolase (beta-lactamase superfamily II)
MMQPSNPAPMRASRLSSLVQVVVAPNPGPMTGPGTNTYVVGTGPTVVIDPAVDDAAYLDAVTAAARDPVMILVTHRHPDHTGGARALAARLSVPVRAFGPAPAGGETVVPLEPGSEVELGEARLEVVHAPGHAPDHLCFVMEGPAALFAGDNVLGEGTAVIAPPDGDMRAYLHTLEKLLDLGIERIYPGHWGALDRGKKVIEGYIAHRREREAQILDALGSGAETPEEIVERVYVDTPSHLHPLAAAQVVAHLEMLVGDGRARRLGQRWKLVDVD